MKPCPKCQKPMIRAGVYDPDGEIPLYGGEQEFKNGELKEWWVCISSTCEDGRRNVRPVFNPTS